MEPKDDTLRLLHWRAAGRGPVPAGSRRRAAGHEGLRSLRGGGNVDSDRRQAHRRFPHSPSEGRPSPVAVRGDRGQQVRAARGQPPGHATAHDSKSDAKPCRIEPYFDDGRAQEEDPSLGRQEGFLQRRPGRDDLRPSWT